MAERPKKDEPLFTGKEKVADLTVEDFALLVGGLLHQRRSEGDPRLLDLTVKEFTETIFALTKTQAYEGAQQEREVGQRVLEDWAGLKAVSAVTTPFRVKSQKDVEDLSASLLPAFSQDSKTEFVVAVAIVSPGGSYRALK